MRDWYCLNRIHAACDGAECECVCHGRLKPSKRRLRWARRRWAPEIRAARSAEARERKLTIRAARRREARERKLTMMRGSRRNRQRGAQIPSVKLQGVATGAMTRPVKASAGASAALPLVGRLPWSLLPPGQMPWSQVAARVRPYVRRLTAEAQTRVEVTLRALTEDHAPDFVAVGRDSFDGYLVFAFQSKGVFILESLEYGNATYVFGEDWERLSRLTKKELIEGSLHRERIVHKRRWAGRIRAVLA